MRSVRNCVLEGEPCAVEGMDRSVPHDNLDVWCGLRKIKENLLSCQGGQVLSPDVHVWEERQVEQRQP